ASHCREAGRCSDNHRDGAWTTFAARTTTPTSAPLITISSAALTRMVRDWPSSSSLGTAPTITLPSGDQVSSLVWIYVRIVCRSATDPRARRSTTTAYTIHGSLFRRQRVNLL